MVRFEKDIRRHLRKYGLLRYEEVAIWLPHVHYLNNDGGGSAT